MPPRTATPEDAILRAADAVGGLMEFWGFKRNMGRLWALLYLESEPLSAADLSERLSLSTGAVSMTLSELSKWGAVKKAWVPGERRDYYEPETSIWKMVSRVFRERELRQIQAAIEAFENAAGALEAHRARAAAATREGTEFALARLRRLLELARVGEKLLNAVLSGEPVDASPIAAFRDSSE
jgi:DNA-binding transcriptional regulator GbsR (MarR family)